MALCLRINILGLVRNGLGENIHSLESRVGKSWSLHVCMADRIETNSIS